MKIKRLWIILIAVSLVVFAGSGSFFFPERQRGHEHGEAFAANEETEEKVRYTCGMHPFIIQDEPGLCPICGMKLTPMKTGTGTAAGEPAERKIKHWVSPMDPTYIRDEPGQDYMGHDLVPVYEGGAAPGQIVIDPTTIQNMGVRTAPVERRDLDRTIRTVGLVTYEEPTRYSINSKIEGWIERLHINQVGQRVEKGQPLMEIYSPELVAAQQEYLLALEHSERLTGNSFPEIAAGAGRMLNSARTRLKYWDISEKQIKELEQNREVKKNLTLYSPYSGVVTEKPAVEGMRIMSGMELMRISDLSRVWVNADIYEFELPWVKTGLKAEVELPSARQRLEGKITFIYPYLQGETRTVKARIEFPNPGLELKPGMFANVSIAAEPVKDALAVPENAVLRSGTQQKVFVALGEGRFEPRVVTTGVSDDEGFIQLLSGVRMGERVVTSAQFLFDSESRLQEAIQKMMPPEPQKQEPAGEHTEHEAGGMDELFEPEPQEQEQEQKLEDLFK
ncbi:MAG: efflux RND transporter periplasmic adaptor subunit [Desulfobulbaceae bacterium]|nr:efflux RND transporter periplasmic adaptor subunit [Desulfobulbaceae bacterium]